jgi:hypothetical protein
MTAKRGNEGIAVLSAEFAVFVTVISVMPSLDLLYAK